MAFATIALVASGISTALGMVGSIQQGMAASSAAKADAAAAERNRILADQERVQALRTAEIASEDQRREARRHYAAMRAQYGGSGLEIAGSPLDALADSSLEMALDSRRTDYEGKARGHEGALRSLAFSEQASAARRRAGSSLVGGFLGAGASLGEGLGRTYDRYQTWSAS